MAKAAASKNGRRVAVVAGARTPFVRAGTVFKSLSTLDLAKACVTELIARSDVDRRDIEQLVYGQVVPSIEAPNIAREIVLGTGLPPDIDAYSVVRACATSTQAVASAAQAILLGEVDVVIAGGADSVSRPPVTLSDPMVDALVSANNAKTPLAKARSFLDLKPKDLLPKPPALRELSTGLTMGEACEKMAKENGISRAAQDAFAVASHHKAAAAWEKGIYAEEVIAVAVGDARETVRRDGFVRADTSVERLAELKPAFDKRHGTLTAGNSSGLSDGASAVLLMSEEKARALGKEPLAYVRAWAFAGIDAAWQLLMGPSFAVPLALDRAGLRLADVDLIDVHEAFAAQVLSNLQAWGSASFAKERLGRDEAIGAVAADDPRLNVHGGSIALGHPFAATGTRQVLTMAKELARRGGGTALITQCAAGGLGAALILER